MTSRVIVVALMVLICRIGVCQHESIGVEPMQEKTYASSAGVYTLKVEPVSRAGVGPAIYVLCKNGKPAWTKELPFALREAVISAKGVIAGYAYRKDRPAPFSDVDVLSCHVIDSEGKERFTWSKDRRPWGPGSPNIPLGLGVVSLEEREEVLFRILRAKEVKPRTFDFVELWMFVSLRTFECLRSIDPCAGGTEVPHSLEDVLAVPGLPVLLASRRIYPGSGQTGRFLLLDANGVELWNSGKLEQAGGGDPAQEDAVDRDAQKPLCGPGEKPGEFWISSDKVGIRIHCRTSTDGKVEIVRSERIAEPGEAGTEKKPEYTKMPKVLAAFPLETRWVPGSVPEWISLFDFADEGDVGCIVADGGLYFYLMSKENKVKAWKEIDLGLAEGHRPIDFKRWIGNRWLLLTERDRGNSEPRMLVLSGMGAVEGELKWNLKGAVRFITHADAGVTVLFRRYDVPDRITKFDREGKTLWTEEVESCSEDIGLLSGGRVAVLSHIPPTVESFSGEGKRLRKLELPEAGEEVDEQSGGLSYPVMLACDDKGSILIMDGPDRYALQRFGEDGGWKEALFLQAEDGRRIGHVDDIGIDRDGRVWVAEGALCRIGSKGKVDRVLGARPSRGNLKRVDKLMTDPSGNLVCFDKFHHTVASFDQQGRQLSWFRLSPGGEDPIASEWGEDVFIDSEGLLNILTRENCYIRYDLAGKSMGRLEERSARGWIAVDDRLLRLDPSGKVLKEIDKDVRGHWFGIIMGLQADHLGQVLVEELLGGEYDLRRKLSIFDPTGKPLGAIPYEERWKNLADPCLSGKQVYFLDYKSDLVLVTDHSGRQVALFPGPGDRPEGFTNLSGIWADGRNGRLFVLAKDRVFVLETSKE